MEIITGKLFRAIDRLIKTVLAFLISMIPLGEANRIRGERCWLIGSSVGQAYSDNSAALHKYIVENHPHINVYWIINKNSPDVDKARRVGAILYREELKTFIYGLLAQVHIVSHGLHDVPTCSSRLSQDAVKVRLGHGLTALKKTSGSFLKGVQAKNQVFDLVPVSSQFEAQIKQSWGFSQNKLIVTGLPRFDELLRKRDAQSMPENFGAKVAKILYMPTWRDWLPSKGSNLHESGFYAEVVNFLMSPELNELLSQHNVFIYVHLHIIMQNHLASMAAGLADLSNVCVLPLGTDLQDEIVDSQLLITDYSSVAWDYLYLNKPVLFYQFDLPKFNQYRGSYIDMKDLFGPVAYDTHSAIELTTRFIRNDFDCAEYSEMMAQWQKKVFPYRDAKNCQRTTEAIFNILNT